MKKHLLRLAAALLLTGLLSFGAAAEQEPAFSFDLSVDGKTEKTVTTGDIITVTLTLRRRDSGESYPMYAMQDEICYDADFFRLVPGSGLTAANVVTRDVALRDYHRAYYMNYLSLTGGRTWEAETLVGSFQLEVVGTAGAARIFSSNPQVARQDGSGSYPASGQDVTVLLSDRCTAVFETGGGTAVPGQTVSRGGLLQRPADPSRFGYAFSGWYRDVDCTEPWDFQRDKVDINLHLYAGWKADGTGHRYSDVAPGDWFAADVEYVSAHGLMDGTGNGAFSPYVGTNRAMIVTILWRLEGKPSAGSPLTFQDVPAGQWYTEAVRWAAEKGIVTGYSGDKFGPTDAVTREQMAAILFRYARYKHYNVTARADLSAFTDCGKVSSWAAEAMSWANAAGLINGLGDGRLAPQSSAVRCQTAAMLHRFCKIS